MIYTNKATGVTVNLDKKFELDGKTYLTDAETLQILRTIVPRAKKTGDTSALVAVMALGQNAGRVKYIGEYQPL